MDEYIHANGTGRVMLLSPQQVCRLGMKTFDGLKHCRQIAHYLGEGTDSVMDNFIGICVCNYSQGLGIYAPTKGGIYDTESAPPV
jgi:hypothetical protein